MKNSAQNPNWTSYLRGLHKTLELFLILSTNTQTSKAGGLGVNSLILNPQQMLGRAGAGAPETHGQLMLMVKCFRGISGLPSPSVPRWRQPSLL